MSVQKAAFLLVLVVLCASYVDASTKIRSKRVKKVAVAKGQRVAAREKMRFRAVQDPQPESVAAATTDDKAASSVDRNCEIGTWSLATPCNASCGGGFQEFHLVIRQQASGAGTACPTSIKYEPCHTDDCPVDCDVGAWSEYTGCSAECGQSGTYIVTRTVKPGNEKGRRCPPSAEERPCNRFECPEDCELSEWEESGVCTKSCGTGVQKWVRKIQKPAKDGGRACLTEDLVQEQECNIHECPVDCVVSEFEPEGKCTKDCAGGIQNFTRTIVTHPLHGGRPCPELRTELPCNMAPCVTDCEVSRWDPQGGCSKPCGTGLQNWTRHAIVEPSKNAAGAVTGRPCPDLFEQRECNTHVCPRDCAVGPWTEEGSCSAPCGGGVITWVRNVVTSKSEDGRECPPLREQRPCNTDPCARRTAESS